MSAPATAPGSTRGAGGHRASGLRRLRDLRDPGTRVLLRRVGIAVLLLVVLGRPGYGQAELAAQTSDLDVVVVVDRTRSMAALDQDGGTRLAGVQADLEALARDLPGARFAMIAFGSTARQVMPLTTDTSAFGAAVQTIDLENPNEGDGSRAERALVELGEVLRRAREADPDRRRVVVYAGDGEETAGTSGEAGADVDPATVADEIDGGVVLGYGSTQGAPMLAGDTEAGLGVGADGYVLDSRTGQSAVSRADPDNLRALAEGLGLPFRERTGLDGDGMAGIAAGLGAEYADGVLGGGPRAAHDLTWLAGLGLFGLLLAELRPTWRTVWRAREELSGRSRP